MSGLLNLIEFGKSTCDSCSVREPWHLKITFNKLRYSYFYVGVESTSFYSRAFEIFSTIPGFS